MAWIGSQRGLILVKACSSSVLRRHSLYSLSSYICNQNHYCGHDNGNPISSNTKFKCGTKTYILQQQFSTTAAEKETHRSSEKQFKVIQFDKELDKSSESFKDNEKRFSRHVKDLKQAEAVAKEGGGQKSIERHVKRHGKLMISDRVKLLVDDVDDFLELSLTAGLGMQYGHVPRASMLTGIGKVRGRYCIIMANDGAFKGGAVYPITLKKNLRAQEIAAQNRLPCVYLVDSAGAFLPLQAQIFNEGGQSFYNEAILGAARIPQVAIVCGSCTAGGAYIPTMADETVIVSKTGTIFLAGPPLVQAALGEKVSAEDLGGATVHCGTSGCTDYFADNEMTALEMGRDIVSALNVSCNDEKDFYGYDEPLYDVEDIAGLVPPPDMQHDMDMYQVIARLVDGSHFHEFKSMFGSCLITGYAHIQGHIVGIIANQRGILGEKEATKATHFVMNCCERNIPLIFLQNTAEDPQTCFGSSEDAKGDLIQQGLTVKSQAALMSVISCSKVPKLTVVVGNGFGYTHYLMGGRAVSPNFLFAWPNARISEMNPKDLASAIAQQSGVEDDEAISQIVEKLEKQSSALHCSTHMHNDGVILPQDTRKVLAQCLSICKAYKQPEQQTYPVLRM